MTPMRPKHPCNFPNCPAIVSERYCPEHKRLTDQKYYKERELEIGQPYATRQHRNWRLMILNRDPICMICHQAPSNEADHIDGDRDNYAMENGQGLCRPCHSRKTAEEQGRWGR